MNTKIIFSLSLISTAASASPRVELGLAVGGHDFSKNVELGVTDTAAEPGPDSSAMAGVRVALPLVHRLALEGEAMWIPTKDDVLGMSATVFGLRAHVRFDLIAGHRLVPFVVAGAGMHVMRSSSPQMSNDVDQAYHWGGGVRWALNDRYDLRLDLRQLFVPDRKYNGATEDYEVTAGFTYRLGSTPKPSVAPPPVVEEPPPVVEAPPPPPPPPPEVKPEVLAELEGIGFELNSATIDKHSAPILEKAYDLLSSHPKVSIEIAGYTSSEGGANRNLELSLHRSEAVKAYLVGRGIDASRIQAVGHGAEDPRADNATEEGRRRNRRIEFHLLAVDGQ